LMEIPVVAGSSHNPNLELILQARPDVVVADGMLKEDLRRKLEAAGIPVIIDSPSNPERVLPMVRYLGVLLGREERAGEQQLRRQLIKDFLDFLNSCSDLLVLKDGTALMMCYGLDHFSEDIDLDMLSSDKTVMQNILQKYCSKTGYTFRTAKQTNTTERYILHYDDTQTLKIEVSHRKVASKKNIKQINGIQVYDIDTLCILKKGAYDNRMRIRDLYDLVFICNNYWNELSPVVKSGVLESLSRDVLERFDYLIRQEHYEYIDVKKLENNLLELLFSLEIIKENKQEKENIR